LQLVKLTGTAPLIVLVFMPLIFHCNYTGAPWRQESM
jgi:hypothetical protein